MKKRIRNYRNSQVVDYKNPQSTKMAEFLVLFGIAGVVVTVLLLILTR